MTKEPKGFCSKDGKVLERKIPKSTSRGIILYKGRGDDWKIDFPNDTIEYGGVTTIRLMNLIYYLQKTNGNVEKSYELSFPK